MKRVLFTLACTGLLGMVSAKEEKRLVLREGWDDLPARDYSNLWIKSFKVKEEENGLAALEKLREELEILSGFTNGGYREMIDLRGQERIKAMTDVYEKVKHKYTEVERALAKPYLYEDTEIGIYATSPQTIGLITLNRYLQLRTIVLAAQNKLEEALASYDQQILLSQKFRKTGRHLIDALVVRVLESAELDAAASLLDLAKDDKILRARIITKLKRKIPHKQLMKKAMQCEFLFHLTVVKSFTDGDLSIANSMFFDVWSTEDDFVIKKGAFWENLSSPEKVVEQTKKMIFKLATEVSFQPQKVAKIQYDDFVRHCEMIKLPAHELIDYKKSKEAEKLVSTLKKNRFKADSNMMGNALVALSTPQIDRQIIRMHVYPQAIELLITRDALRRYRVEKGELPETLASLVPHYLEKIPVDMFSKQGITIKYDKKKEMIWSIGIDGKDNFTDSNEYGVVYSKGSLLSDGIMDDQPRMFVD